MADPARENFCVLSETCSRHEGTLYGNIEREHPMTTDTFTAVQFIGATDSQGFPPAAAWETAPPLRFDADCQGKNSNAHRETEVRLLWTPQTLYLRFRLRCRINN